MSFKNIVSSTWSMTRMGNLLMICFIMYLVRYSIIIPILGYTGLQPALGNYHFALTVIGTMLIACGGYIINDFFDTGIDKINKPGKNVIGDQISKRATKKAQIIPANVMQP